jgi:hypothetical protein
LPVNKFELECGLISVKPKDVHVTHTITIFQDCKLVGEPVPERQRTWKVGHRGHVARWSCNLSSPIQIGRHQVGLAVGSSAAEGRPCQSLDIG